MIKHTIAAPLLAQTQFNTGAVWVWENNNASDVTINAVPAPKKKLRFLGADRVWGEGGEPCRFCCHRTCCKTSKKASGALTNFSISCGRFFQLSFARSIKLCCLRIHDSKKGFPVLHKSSSGYNCRPNPSILSNVFCKSIN